MKMETDFKDLVRQEVLGIILASFGILTAVALLWDTQAVGAVGGFLARVALGFAGEGQLIFALILLILGAKMVFFPRGQANSARRYGGALLVFTYLSWLHLPITLLYGGLSTSYLEAALEGNGGGLLGAITSLILVTLFGDLGSRIVMVSATIVGFLLLANTSLSAIISSAFNKLKTFFRRLGEEISEFLFTVVEDEDDFNQQKGEPVIISGSAPSPPEHDSSAFNEPGEGELVGVLVKPQAVKEEGKKEPKTAKLPPAEEPNLVPQLPPLTLLKPSLRLKNTRLNKDITDNIKLVEDTLASFGVHAKVAQVSCGPTITRYELHLAPGVKVSRIISLSDDLALSLAVPQVRIEAPIPGKAAVGVEVPNKEIATVTLREILETPTFMESSSLLSVALGKDIAGNPIVADLAKMPHLLIAGATGAGKSVCMNSLICSLLYKARADQLKFLMIDPKMVELTTYNGIPHLISPVVTDPKKAATALKWVVAEMENRYELFAAAGVKDIERYNRLKSKEEPEKEGLALPYVVVLIDELADLMMVAPTDVEDAICRLAQMARAAGIHLVVATQRPSVDVLTGLIKANIPSRIAFAVSSQTDSRVILDQGGAEKLLGRGDMLFMPIGAAKPVRTQGVFVSDQEVENVVVFLKQQGRPEYAQGIELIEQKESEASFQDDPLLAEAVKLFLENGQASISLLQRRLHVGYSRAARLVDIMEQKGIVGGFEGSKPRALLIGWDDYSRMFGA